MTEYIRNLTQERKQNAKSGSTASSSSEHSYLWLINSISC